MSATPDETLEEIVDLYLQHIKAATQPFIEISAKPRCLVGENHPSVRESFLKTCITAHQISTNDLDDCTHCGRSLKGRRDFIIDPKYEHLRIAITCRKSCEVIPWKHPDGNYSRAPSATSQQLNFPQAGLSGG